MSENQLYQDGMPTIVRAIIADQKDNWWEEQSEHNFY